MAEKGGKRAGAGRKTKAQELGLAEIIDSVWTIPKQKNVLKQLVNDCSSSDFHQRHEARKLLLSYKFGKPTERKEITGAIETRTHSQQTQTPEQLARELYAHLLAQHFDQSIILEVVRENFPDVPAERGWANEN